MVETFLILFGFVLLYTETYWRQPRKLNLSNSFILHVLNLLFSDVQKLSLHESRTHSRSSSEASRGLSDDSILGGKNESGRTESPDNDSAFSDTVSMLSSESSASSGGSGAKPQTLNLQNIHQVSRLNKYLLIRQLKIILKVIFIFWKSADSKFWPWSEESNGITKQ